MFGNRMIVTNNPLVRDLINTRNLTRQYSLCWISGCTEAVLAKTCSLCHKSYLLITHPLTGSIKPNQTPYKTIVLEKSADGTSDYQSIWIAESSFHKAMSLLQSRPRPPITESILGDFAVIDLSFFTSYLESVTN
ncbi:MAG: GrdX family protein [Veillonellales bacterium]